MMKNLRNILILMAKNFLFIKEAMKKIEKQNNIPINVFGYDDERPYHIYTLKETLKNPIMS